MLLYLLITTYPNLELAKEVSSFAVKEKLAACAQVSDTIISFYKWDNFVHEDQEYRVIFKTNFKQLNALKYYIHSQHPYKVPQIIMLPVYSNNSYAEWVYHYLS